MQKPSEEDDDDDDESDEDDEEESDEEQEEESEGEVDDESEVQNIEKNDNGVSSTPHPSEEQSQSREGEKGLDVIGNSSFDEVDVTASTNVSLPEVDTTDDSLPSKQEDGDLSKSEQEQVKSTLEVPQDNLSDDDDASFTSATSEPLENEFTESPAQLPGQENHSGTEIAVPEVPDESEAKQSTNVLHDVGLDSSIFGKAESEDGNDADNSSTTVADKNTNEDESSLFFGTTTTTNTGNEVSTTTPSDSPNKLANKEEKNKSSLFDDDDEDEDDFFTKAAEKVNIFSTKLAGKCLCC